MPPSCQAAALPTEIRGRWLSELQSFSPRGCFLKTVPHLAVSRGPRQTAGGLGASLTHALLLCSEGTSTTSPPPLVSVGQLLVASYSARRIFASSCRGAVGCCSALGCGPPSFFFFFFGSKRGLRESCSPPHFISALPVAACHPLSCADTTAYEATPLSQVAKMPCGELGHKEGKELEEMG